MPHSKGSYRFLYSLVSGTMESKEDSKGMLIIDSKGDYNLDGYPDLLVTTNKQVLLLENTVCNNRLCSSLASQAGRRTFTIVKDGTDALTKISRPKHATFFDIDEDVSTSR